MSRLNCPFNHCQNSERKISDKLLLSSAIDDENMTKQLNFKDVYLTAWTFEKLIQQAGNRL